MSCCRIGNRELCYEKRSQAAILRLIPMLFCHEDNSVYSFGSRKKSIRSVHQPEVNNVWPDTKPAFWIDAEKDRGRIVWELPPFGVQRIFQSPHRKSGRGQDSYFDV